MNFKIISLILKMPFSIYLLTLLGDKARKLAVFLIVGNSLKSYKFL